MKIKAIHIYKKDLGNMRPYTIAFKTVGDVSAAIVEIEFDNGIIGFGSGNPSQHVVGESLEESIEVLKTVDFLEGLDIRKFSATLSLIQEKLPNSPTARAALDIALHDGFCKFLETPLAQFYGQRIKSLPTSVTIGINDVDETIKESQEYIDLGFKILKVKMGHDVDMDIERIKKIRERFGNKIKVRVDANQGYDADAVVKFYNSTKDDNIELIEQPTNANDINLMKSLPDNIKKIVAADESLLSASHAIDLISSPRACGIFNIKLMKTGGIFHARQIADIAKNSHTDLMWGCNDESAISISAALHSALTYKNTKYIDLDGSLDVIEDVVEGGFQLKDGYMSITDAPGLGVKKIIANN